MKIGIAAGIGGAVMPSAMVAGADNSRTVAYVYDEQYLLHPHRVETPQRLAAIHSHLEQQRILDRLQSINPVASEIDPMPFIGLIHTQAHIRAITAMRATGQTAVLAVKGVLEACRQVAENRASAAFCAIRPPGHHANNLAAEEGFCFFSNAAIAARYLQRQHGFRKICVIDWDYHHGNGTQNAFSSDPTVLFFSTHDYYAYPGTGDPGFTGEGRGKGFTINVHLPGGATDDDMIGAWERSFLPKAHEFEPDFIIISAGFDSKENDMLGSFRITPDGFAQCTRMALDLANRFCRGRVVSILEGGYADRSLSAVFGGRASYNGLAECAAAHVEALMG